MLTHNSPVERDIFVIPPSSVMANIFIRTIKTHLFHLDYGIIQRSSWSSKFSISNFVRDSDSHFCLFLKGGKLLKCFPFGHQFSHKTHPLSSQITARLRLSSLSLISCTHSDLTTSSGSLFQEFKTVMAYSLHLNTFVTWPRTIVFPFRLSVPLPLSGIGPHSDFMSRPGS